MAKRIAQSSMNWGALAERVAPSQKNNFAVFKAKSDGYLRRVLANPPEAPKIDWAFYKNNVAIAGMVDNFQKQYDSLKIPFPADSMSSQVDAQAKEVQGEIAAFVKESNVKIAGYENELKHLNSLLPYDQMTMEDFADSHPNESMDMINRPSIWPHTPEEQPGFVDPNAAPAEHHH